MEIKDLDSIGNNEQEAQEETYNDTVDVYKELKAGATIKKQEKLLNLYKELANYRSRVIHKLLDEISCLTDRDTTKEEDINYILAEAKSYSYEDKRILEEIKKTKESKVIKLEITKEAFYLHEALKIIQESGFKHIYVGFDEHGMNILIYEYAKSQTYIRNISANSIQASLMELKDIYTGEFKEEKSSWSKVEPDFKYVKLEEVLEGPLYTAWGKNFFKKETTDGYSIERKWEF